MAPLIPPPPSSAGAEPILCEDCRILCQVLDRVRGGSMRGRLWRRERRTRSSHCGICAMLNSWSVANPPPPDDLDLNPDLDPDLDLEVRDTVFIHPLELCTDNNNNTKTLLLQLQSRRFKTQSQIIALTDTQHTTQPKGGPAYLNAPNYPLIRSWIASCEKNHLRSCYESKEVLPPGFRLLDINTRQVITVPLEPNSSGPRVRYVAVSYVWGKKEGDISPSDYDASGLRFPALIEDIMTVAKALGYTYVWVDRYCVPQDDATAKHVQIQNMGDIYRIADLTIVASRGSNPTIGLNGVSEPREPPYQAGHLIFSPAHDAVQEEIHQSQWNSRGWTYQEAILSRRLLVFTSTQCYYQCRAMFCLECCPLDVSKSRHVRASPMIKPVFSLPDSSDDMTTKRSPESSFSELDNYIDEYSSRTLTFDTDRFNAIRGVLNHFESRVKTIRMFYGIPLATGLGLPNNTSVLTVGLSWYPRTFYRGERVPCFPSWSWLGWKYPTIPWLGRNRRESGFHLRSTSLRSGSILGTKAKQKQPQVVNMPMPVNEPDGPTRPSTRYQHQSLVDVTLVRGDGHTYDWETSLLAILQEDIEERQHTMLSLRGWSLDIQVEWAQGDSLRRNTLPEVFSDTQWEANGFVFHKRGFIDSVDCAGGRMATGILVHSRISKISSSTHYPTDLPSWLAASFRKLCPLKSENQVTLGEVGIMLVTRQGVDADADAAPSTYVRSGWLDVTYIAEALGTVLDVQNEQGLGKSLATALCEVDGVCNARREEVLLC